MPSHYRDPADDFGFTKYVAALQKWTEACCAPIFFRNESERRVQGTMTFVNTGDEILGVTAGHVADRILECCDGKPGHGCQIGFAELDPGRLIARNPTLDLASFRLSNILATTARKDPLSSDVWPPRPPDRGERVLVGGYPGIFRKENEPENQIEVGYAHFLVSVDDSLETEFTMALNIASSTSIGGARIAERFDMGGISGGGVFRVLEDGLISRIELIGIVHRGLQNYEIVFAHPLSSLKSDGTFTG